MTIRDDMDTAEATAGTQPSGTAELRRLVNAVIWPGFSGRTVPAWLDTELRHGLAGVVYFSQNIEPRDPAALAGLSASITEANPLAVIGCDEEGGNVTRLESGGGSSIPGAAVLGRIDDVDLTRAAGRAIGLMCRDAGINLALSPVADVNTNPLNPVIGIRSFGAGAGLVGRHTAAMVEGIQSAGVGACAKHFPGHGDTVTDSHLELPTLGLALKDITAHHLPPFRDAVGADVKSVMTAHIVIPELGPAPATLNPSAGSMLRGLGFAGLQITDALDMAAIRATTGMGRGAVLALLAGADLLCLGNPDGPGTTTDRDGGRPDEAAYLEVRDSLLAAVQDGTLPVELLRTAGRRVADFAVWAREASTADAAQTAAAARRAAAQPAPAQAAAAAPDWVGVAAEACTYSPSLEASTVALPARTREVLLVDARPGNHQASGRTAGLFAAALSEYVLVTPLPASAVPGSTPEPGQAMVVLVGSLDAGGRGLAAAQAARSVPGAVCINTGISEAGSPPLPTVNCFGYSRATARAVARILHAELPHHEDPTHRADPAVPAPPRG